MSNLLFNYDELVRGGDSSFAVDYMVERILEKDAIYAEPTQEVKEKVDDLANFSSPEDADEYIWEWLDGLAEEKGTWVYTLMFDQIWVSDGSSYDLHDYDFDEEDEEAIKFAGSPLEEHQTLNEAITINNLEFETLVDRLVDKEFKYYPYDPNIDRANYGVFVWLEGIAGDNQRAFSFIEEKNQFGKLVSVSIVVMPGEQLYHYYDPSEEDIELLQGIGDINEVYGVNWSKDVDFSDPEDLADALVKEKASFIDPDFFYEEIAIDVDRTDDDADYEDIYYEALAQALFDAYGDDKLYYTFYYDDPSNNHIMLFSDGEYAYIEDSYNWTDDDYEMVIGAGQLNETINEDFVVDSAEDFANALAEKGARYVEIPGDKMADFQQISNKNPLDADDDVHELIYEFLMEKYKTGDSLVYTYYDYDGTIHTFDGNIGDHYWVDDFKDVPYNYGIELIIGAGQLNELKESYKEELDEIELADLLDHITKNGLSVREIEGGDIDELEEIAAEYWEEDDDGDGDFNDDDPGFFENLKRRFSLFANEGEMVIFYTPDWYYTLPFVGKLGDDTLWTYDSIKGFQSLSPVSQENLDDILEAGSLFQENKAKEQIEEKDSRPNPHYGWDAGIMWGVEGDIEETADRLAELGAEFIEFPEELLPDIGSHTYDDDEAYFQELADIFLDKYGLEPNLKYAMEENDDEDPVFIFSDGTYWVGYGISSEDVELIVNAGQLNESLADQPTYVKIEALANDVVEQDLQYYELSNDEREDLIELAAMIGDGEQPIAKWDKTIINILKKQRSKTGKEHYTVTPTMTQIQYPEEQVIDYMYFDEFLTRFLPNADKSDLELLRGAGQLNENLNEVELPSYMKGFRNEDEFRYEVLADNLAEEGAKYIDANTLDFLPDNLDTVDKDDDTVFSVSNKVTDFVEEKVKEFSKKFSNDSTLKFTIWEFETEATGYRHNIFILFSDYHYIDAWATGTDDLALVIGSGRLNEIESPKGKFGNWWSEVEWNSPTKGEQLADVLASMGAEYIPEEKWNTRDKDKYLDNGDIDGYISDVAYDFKIHSYDKPRLTFSLVEIGDEVHLISSTEFTYDMWDFSADDIELIIGAGQLNEYDRNWADELSFNTETSAEDVADRLVKIGAKYVEVTADIEPEEEYHETFRDYLDRMAELFSEKYGHEEELYFTYYVDDDAFIFSDGTYWYDEAGFLADDVELIIGAGQLNENQTLTEDEYPDPESAEDIADFLSKNEATFHELTSDEIDVIGDAWAYGGSRSGQEAGYQTTKDILKKHKEAGRPIFTYDEEGMFYILFNDGTGGAYHLEGFEDMEEPEAYDLIINAGNLYEEEKKYVDPLGSMTDSSSGLQFADALAEAGARYIDTEEIDRIENAIADEKYIDGNREWRDDVIYELKNQFKSDDTIVFAYIQTERVFITWDGKYYESFYMDEFTDVSGTADVRMIIDAGMLNEALNLEDPKIGDMIDAYTYDIYALIDPKGYNEGNVRELSSDTMYKYEDEQNPADYHMENSWKTLPKPISDQFEDILGSSWMQERASDYTRDEFFENNKEAYNEFYGMHDEVDEDLLRDAGYDKWAEQFEEAKDGQIASFLEDDYEIKFGASIKTDFDRDPESIFVYIYCVFNDFSEGETLKEVELGKAYKNIDSVEALKEAMKEFMYDLVPKFMAGEKPAKITTNDVYERQKKKPLKEGVFEFEDLITNIVEWPLHYVDPPKDILDSIANDAEQYGMDMSEVETELWERLSKYLGTLDRNAGYADEEGYESDEGFFTIIDSDFWEDAGFTPNPDMYFYIDASFSDGYELTPEQYKDIIEAGKLYNNDKLLNESIKFEELIDNITKWPLHYVEIPADLEKKWIDDLTAYGTPQDTEEVSDYLVNNISDYLEKLDRKAGYVDSEGQPETDEGHFTMLDSDFYQELGLFYDSFMYELYTNIGLYGTYELTSQQYSDVIEAGQIYDNPLKEQEKETDDYGRPHVDPKGSRTFLEPEYNPTFEQIDEMIENATEELIDGISRTFDSYGDPTIERLESGEGFVSFADGGFRSHETSNVSNLYGQYAMPTNEIDDALEKIYDRVFEYAHESAVEWMKKENPEVWAEFSGDPELLTYKNLYDAGEAYQDVDEERSKIYYDAAEELDQYERDYMYEDDDSTLFFEIEIQYFNANATMNDTDLPMLKFRGAVESNYKALGAKETERTFTSEEELEEALTSGAKEIEDWFDGEERNQNRVGQLTEELSPESSLEIFEIVKSIVEDNTRYPVLENPIADQEIDQDVGIYSYTVYEDYYIDLMKYLSNERVLPRDFQKNEEQYVEERIWGAAEDEVLGNLDEYLSAEKSMEIKGVHYEIAKLYQDGELEDIDPELYEELHQNILEKSGDYMDDTGVMLYFEIILVPEEELVTLIAKVELDPEYDGIEHKKSIEIKIESDLDEFAKKVDQATKELVSWMQGN